MELAQAAESFLRDCAARDLSLKTRRRYHDDLQDLAAFLAHQSVNQLTSITADHLRAWLIDLQNRPNQRRPHDGLSAFSIDGMYRTIKTFFTFCEVEEYLIDNPMVRVRHIKLPQRIVPRLNENQIAELLDELKQTLSPERNLALILLMVDSGLRRGEVIGLTLDKLFINERRARVTGKGRKDRDVPLGDATAAALSAWLAIRPVSLNQHVFLNVDGSPFRDAGVRSLFVRLQIRLGLRRLYPHLLRHTFAKHYLKQVKDVKSLQLILGHSKSSTTLDLYVDYDFEEVRALHRLGSPIDQMQKQKRADD